MADFDLGKMLGEVGALKQGHFVLSSGRHSAQYLEKFDLLRHPGATERAIAALLLRLNAHEVDLVVGPTTGGILLAFEAARQLGLPAAYAERAESGSLAREFRRGTTIRAGSRVLVVDDILTTGGSVRETLAALAPHAVEVVAVAVLVDRSGGKLDLGVTLLSLARMDIPTWAPEACPLCAGALPVTKPGTTAVPGAAT